MIPTLSGIKTTGGKYIVRYDPLYPHNSEILFDREVRSYLLNFADTGWITIPDFVFFIKKIACDFPGSI
jgi:hypothetical protein